MAQKDHSMPLKALLDNLDELSDAMKPLYRAGDTDATKGKFVLDVEASDGFALEHIEGLRNAFATTKAELEKKDKALEAYKGLPAASTLRDKLKKLDTLEAINPQDEAAKIVEGRVRAAVDEVTSQHVTEMTKVKADNDRLWGAYESAAISTTAKDAIAKENGSAALLMPHIKARTKIDRETLAVSVLKDDGQPFYNNKGQPATIEDLVGDLKKHPDYGRAFEATASGSGASGNKTPGAHAGGKSNPWAKSTWNLTEQMKITRADPNTAAFMKSTAGA